MKMKQTLTILGGLMVAVNLFAQGLVNFANSPQRAVIDGNTQAKAEPGLYTAGLYYTTDLGSTPNPDIPNDGWLLAATTPIVSGLGGGGLYSAGIVEVPGVTGGTAILVQIRAWSDAFADFEAAWNSGDVNTMVGATDWVNNPIQVTLATPGTVETPPPLSGLVQSFTLTPIPEPSTFVLGLLGGLGAMVLLRRRK
jgi:hypothetical protein